MGNLGGVIRALSPTRPGTFFGPLLRRKADPAEALRRP
jgi:hypothetical protein